MGGALEALLGSLGQGGNGTATFQQLLFSLAHQGDEDFALAATLAAKAAHDLGEGVLQALGLVLELGGPVVALLRDVVDERERFFCALYSVVASVTRWLPCSLGKVSMTR